LRISRNPYIRIKFNTDVKEVDKFIHLEVKFRREKSMENNKIIYF
jgi:hypothetical protein